ncbi:DUF4124 domain-containing protein [Pseudomonas sp. Hp2]|uniref:DUF4124 domain-containing protein n=1 Tax=Pseudomonas sp. Hp2 TaxID=701189 RepID=UPI00112C1DC4|nr:DUF4124 domain-containing protein [Pseudomonas sp. Hp2]
MKLSCALGLALLAASTAAGAANLYKWKDANGTTHYSERPPEDRKYDTRRIDSRAGVAPAAEAGPARPESSECSTARRNLELLGGSAPVMQDTDGDGKPDAPLDENQRAAQKNLADAAVKAYCAPAK